MHIWLKLLKRLIFAHPVFCEFPWSRWYSEEGSCRPLNWN